MKIKLLEENRKLLASKQLFTFRTLWTFGTFCSVHYSGTVPRRAERSVPSRAEPMQCAGFHLFPLSFTSADCAVPSRADAMRWLPFVST